MSPALLAAYVAIAVVLTCCGQLAHRSRKQREAIATAYACLLVDDDAEAYRVLSAAMDDQPLGDLGLDARLSVAATGWSS